MAPKAIPVVSHRCAEETVRATGPLPEALGGDELGSEVAAEDVQASEAVGAGQTQEASSTVSASAQHQTQLNQAQQGNVHRVNHWLASQARQASQERQAVT